MYKYSYNYIEKNYTQFSLIIMYTSIYRKIYKYSYKSIYRKNYTQLLLDTTVTHIISIDVILTGFFILFTPIGDHFNNVQF